MALRRSIGSGPARAVLWFRLWQASGTRIFMPTNIQHQVQRALDGDGAGLADQLFTAVSEMNADQRAAAAVVGESLAENADLVARLTSLCHGPEQPQPQRLRSTKALQSWSP
ncbi:hypothetical protein [Streptomyces sp. NPDC005181]|uniref:hypothetical protein n=1 Tax=Streptomyces sp. NPDC005181 TaxID=3156869 RepID=UPI00339EFB4A